MPPSYLTRTPANRGKFAEGSPGPSASNPDRTRTLYKPTFFDRHGPDGANLLQAGGYSLLVFACALVLTLVIKAQYRLHGLAAFAVVVVGSPAMAFVAAWAGYHFGSAVGDGWKTIAVDGTSTPYREQFSFQQALVMQGRLDEALQSFEAVIVEQQDSVDARVRAAELYARDKHDARRAAELFREVQRIESATKGEFIYVTNRLVDLYTGPLADPGRALVELRRLIERFPGTSAAEHAREALSRLKAQANAGR